MEMPPTYDEYTVYIPLTEATEFINKENVTLTDVLVAGCKALGIPMEALWIETEWNDSHSI